jgi:hypothetical protein
MTEVWERLSWGCGSARASRATLTPASMLILRLGSGRYRPLTSTYVLTSAREWPHLTLSASPLWLDSGWRALSVRFRTSSFRTPRGRRPVRIATSATYSRLSSSMTRDIAASSNPRSGFPKPPAEARTARADGPSPPYRPAARPAGIAGLHHRHVEDPLVRQNRSRQPLVLRASDLRRRIGPLPKHRMLSEPRRTPAYRCPWLHPWLHSTTPKGGAQDQQRLTAK